MLLQYQGVLLRPHLDDWLEGWSLGLSLPDEECMLGVRCATQATIYGDACLERAGFGLHAGV